MAGTLVLMTAGTKWFDIWLTVRSGAALDR